MLALCCVVRGAVRFPPLVAACTLVGVDVAKGFVAAKADEVAAADCCRARIEAGSVGIALMAGVAAAAGGCGLVAELPGF